MCEGGKQLEGSEVAKWVGKVGVQLGGKAGNVGEW